MSANLNLISAKPAAARPAYYAFLKDTQDVETFKVFAESRHLPEANALSGDAATAADFLTNNAPPSVLIVEIVSASEAPDLLTRLADVCDPDTKVIIVGSINEYSFYCWLMEIGVSSYLLKPLTQQALENAWTKATELPAATTAKTKEPGRLIGFIGTRGGVGSTTVALLVTSLLAQQGGKKVAIVDLDPQDGSISLLLDIEPSRGLREVLEKPDRIDSLFLDRAMQKTEQNFHVLSAEEPLHERVVYHEQAAGALLKELKNQFDIIMLDIPRQYNAFTRACLQGCETVFAVTDMTLPGLRDAMRLGDLFRDNLRLKAPIVIANRLGLAPKQEMTMADFSKGLNTKVEYHIPFAPDMLMNISGELEPLKHRNTPVMKAIQQIASAILPEVTAEDEERKEGAKRKLGWLKKGK